MVASAAGALRGWQEGGREGRPEEGQLLPGLCCGIRGCRVRRVAARVETRERSSDPLARYRATHSRVRRRPLRSGAQHAQPVVRLYPQSLPCLFLSLPFPLSFSPLLDFPSFFSFNHTLLQVYLASFPVYPMRLSIFSPSSSCSFSVSTYLCSSPFVLSPSLSPSYVLLPSLLFSQSLPSSGLACTLGDAPFCGLSPAG